MILASMSIVLGAMALIAFVRRAPEIGSYAADGPPIGLRETFERHWFGMRDSEHLTAQEFRCAALVAVEGLSGLRLAIAPVVRRAPAPLTFSQIPLFAVAA